MLAAGASLSAGRLGGTVLQGTADPVDAVGRQVIDRAPGTLRDSAIGTVGTADKPLLMAAVVLVVLGIGVRSRHHRRWAAVVITALWAVGAVSVAAVPGTTVPAAVLLAAGAGLVGVLVLDLLAPAGAREPGTTPDGPEGHGPAGHGPAKHQPGLASRRVFLTRAAGVLTLAGAALAAGNVFGARALSRAPRGAAGRRAARRPAAGVDAGPEAHPAGDDQHGAVPGRHGAEHPGRHPESWQLTVSGLVDRPLTFSYTDLLGCRRSKPGSPWAASRTTSAATWSGPFCGRAWRWPTCCGRPGWRRRRPSSSGAASTATPARSPSPWLSTATTRCSRWA